MTTPAEPGIRWMDSGRMRPSEATIPTSASGGTSAHGRSDRHHEEAIVAKRTLIQQIEKHLKDAAYWRAKANELNRRAEEAAEKAAALKAQVAEAHRG